MKSAVRAVSWRDPAGHVVLHGDRVLRAIAPDRAASVLALLEEPWYRQLVSDGLVVVSRPVAAPSGVASDAACTWLEHGRIEFPIYPHEITALQLFDAAKLTLHVAREALARGWVLKDASAWNVLFDGARPVFVDVLSFEEDDRSGYWPGYAQFCRHFVIPLTLHRDAGLEPAELFARYRDGVTPERARSMIRGWRRWRSPARETVTIPSLLVGMGRRHASHAAARRPRAWSADVARHVLGKTLARLDRKLDRVRPGAARDSTWAAYEETRSHYREVDVTAKREFVRTSLERSSAGTVLDLGCNAGEHSKIAAALGHRVVAADSDTGALARLYRELAASRGAADAPRIAPVLLDLGRPTPAVGWMNEETASFLDRARGHFDVVLALGLVHHLLVRERATMEMIVRLFRALRPKILVVEWIDPSDPRFVETAGPNWTLYASLDEERFRRELEAGYRIARRVAICEGRRVLYECHAHPAPPHAA